MRSRSDRSNPYEEKNAFWTELAIGQFGIALNFFSFLSIGFLAFIVEKNEISDLLKFNLSHQLDLTKNFILLSLITCFFSVICSCLSILSRLYDLRLTRHTIWTRYRYYKEHKEHLKDNFLKLNNNFIMLLDNFYSTIKKSDYYIKANSLNVIAIISAIAAIASAIFTCNR
ncbi:hypothetical protein [Agriterribacter sp.]|uniref:hypothetical protein n=1 Tax=Agriterribacter sp. TaxID=2821509 RepID=UPI002C21AF94|nr:hypothetical protein [Agriterribacter sp.]HTN05265.1 hypothetical protein [Agriterribacter sp.]